MPSYSGSRRVFHWAFMQEQPEVKATMKKLPASAQAWIHAVVNGTSQMRNEDYQYFLDNGGDVAKDLWHHHWPTIKDLLLKVAEYERS